MTVIRLDTFDLAGHSPQRMPGAPGRGGYEGTAVMYLLFFAGLTMLGTILVAFWLKDVLRSPRLARIVYSELVARLALAGAAFTILGALLIAGDILGGS